MQVLPDEILLEKFRYIAYYRTNLRIGRSGDTLRSMCVVRESHDLVGVISSSNSSKLARSRIYECSAMEGRGASREPLSGKLLRGA